MFCIGRAVARLVLVALLLVAQSAEAAHPHAERGTGGAVASSERAATEVGLLVLRAGGNAADAAVATALALAVVYPVAGNLGGGGFAVMRFGQEVAALDFRETAPAEATRDMYLGPDGEPDRQRSWIGPLAAGVPGSPAGLFELHRRYGRLEWRQVVAPALSLAEQGFTVSDRLSREIEGDVELLQRFPETASVWLPGGAPPAAGSTMKLPKLASTLRAYAEDGPRALTEGVLADAIEAASLRHGGILRADDLAAYRAVWREPVVFEAFGWRFASMPLPSSGGIVIGQSLALLERLGWGDHERFGADRAHVLAEVWRRAYADRFLMGDPKTSGANQAQLLEPEWLDRRAQEIELARATPSSVVRPWSEDEVYEPAATTHLSVVDGHGNAVSLTTTLNGRFGCGLLVPELGILLNNEMDDFSVAPQRANEWGLIQGEANAIGPGKRMLSSMAPTVAWQGSELIVLGARGGSKIPTSVAQVFVNIVVDGEELQAAVNRPRLHHQWLPDALLAELDALSPDTIRVLEQRGHEVRVMRGALSRANTKVNVVRFLEGGRVEAAADPRGPAVAGVVTPDPR
jgi:gamma-glutamyltranspeptidase/glutathione hydrolase